MTDPAFKQLLSHRQFVVKGKEQEYWNALKRFQQRGRNDNENRKRNNNA